jgi:hypothetical protein
MHGVKKNTASAPLNSLGSTLLVVIFGIISVLFSRGPYINLMGHHKKFNAAYILK